MTKPEIAKNLYLLAIDMAGLAYYMAKIDDENMRKHAQELKGSAIIANEWCDEIQKELENENK